MKCPKCGSTLHSFDGCMVGCDNEKCYYRKHFTEYASTLETKKEKVEAELKAIKDRIEAVTEKDLRGCFAEKVRNKSCTDIEDEECEKYYCDSCPHNAFLKILNLIKQIGGVK